MAGQQTYVRFDDATLVDLKVRKLMYDHGFEGIGAYFVTVLHMMHDREDFNIDMVPIVAAECGVEPQAYKALLDDMADIGLIMPEAYAEGMIRSKRVYEELAYLDAQSERGKQGGRPRKETGQKSGTKTDTKSG